MENNWKGSRLASNLESWIMSKSSWIWTRPSVTFMRGRKMSIDTLWSSAFEMLPIFVQSMIILLRAAELTWAAGTENMGHVQASYPYLVRVQSSKIQIYLGYKIKPFSFRSFHACGAFLHFIFWFSCFPSLRPALQLRFRSLKDSSIPT